MQRLEMEIARREEAERNLRDALGKLRVTEEQLRDRRQLELVTDALPVLVAFVDSEQRYRFASAAYERWFGRPKTEIVGKTLREVLGDDAYRAVRPHAERALSGESVTYQAELPYRDGGARFIEASYIPQRDGEGSIVGFVALVLDVTERRTFERFRSAAATRAERLLRITAAIAAAVSTEEVLEALVDRVAEAVGASSSGLWLVDEEQRFARLMRMQGYSETAKKHIETLPLGHSPGVPATDCIRTGEPVWIPSQAAMLERYPHLAQVATAGRAYRVACLPLVANQRVLGALGITIEEAKKESAEEREFLLLVSRYASQAIERLRLLEAERRSREAAAQAAARLAVLNRASRVFADAHVDLRACLGAVATELSSALDSCINVTLIGSDGLLHLTATQHPDPEAQKALVELAPNAPIALGEGVTGTIAATGKSVLLPHIDAEADARAPERYRAFLARYPVYALVGAALSIRGRVIGTVTATRHKKGETYAPEDLRMLEELAERAAVAIENSRLYQETVSSQRQAVQLYRFAQSVVSAERVDEVFDAAIAAIEGALGARRAAVLICDGDGVMRFRAWRNLSEGYRRAVDGHSPWPRGAVSPEPVLVEDAARDPAMAPYASLFRSEGIGALAFIPLVTAGQLLGKFMVYYEQPHVFAPYEIDMARAIANHLSSVVTRFQVIAKLEETIDHNELFAGVLAHDLRNPLGAMMTAAQLLLMRREGDETLGEKETKPLIRILSSGKRMTTMIEQLLDFTRARAGGGIPLDPHEAHLADLCAQAVGEIELAYPEREIRHEAVGDQRGTWDGDRLVQVFSNLIANACQHGTPSAPVLVRLDGDLENEMRIEVRNRGTVPEPLLPHLFDPFRSTRHRHDRSRGLGLGLFIVGEIVRGHGGSVDVSSTESEGTRFTIVLPRHASPRRNDGERRVPWRLI